MWSGTVNDKERLRGIRSEIVFRQPSVRQVDSTWQVTLSEKFGTANVNEHESGLVGWERRMNVPAVGFVSEQALEMAHKADVVIYSISTNISRIPTDGDKVLRYFAEETGGFRAIFFFRLAVSMPAPMLRAESSTLIPTSVCTT